MFFYTFKCECERIYKSGKPDDYTLVWPLNHKKSLHIDREWQIVRYLLEREYKLHINKQAKRNLQRSYFYAEHFDTRKPLQDTEIVEENAKIVISRRPLPMNTLPFVPWRFQQRLLDILPQNASDEQAKIAWITHFSHGSQPSFNTYLHTSAQKPDLPTHTNRRRLLVPKGIPVRQLRAPRTQSEADTAYTDRNGNLVVVEVDCSRRRGREWQPWAPH